MPCVVVCYSLLVRGFSQMPSTTSFMLSKVYDTILTMPEEVRASTGLSRRPDHDVVVDPINLAMGMANRKGVIPLDEVSNLRGSDGLHHL